MKGGRLGVEDREPYSFRNTGPNGSVTAARWALSGLLHHLRSPTFHAIPRGIPTGRLKRGILYRFSWNGSRIASSLPALPAE
jgi:hypothetical protein